jgi:adenosylmethionine-8-amino-7-oxononanoate aminotransferase
LFEREPRLSQVRTLAATLLRDLERCRGLPAVRDVRVLGAIGVVELHAIDDLGALRARFVEEGVFIRPFGSIIYLTPAFTIEADELAGLTGAIVKIVGERAPLND